jgi:transcriptional regulator with XRE-family HTH domain
MGDLRTGRIARALRQRLGLRQIDVADRAGLGHDSVSRLERGRLDGLTLGTIRRVFAVFDSEVVILARWRGGEIDRLIDRRHAELGMNLVQRLEPFGWMLSPEVSFAEYGERGSIDLLGWHAASRTLLVVELKTELTSVEETLRRHDVKVRLAVRVARTRFEWEPAVVGRLLVLPDDRTPRRHVERHDVLFSRAYPMRGSALRRWLATPVGSPIGRRGPQLGGRADGGVPGPAGILFLSSADGARLRQAVSPRRRVRRPRTAESPSRTADSPSGADVNGG